MLRMCRGYVRNLGLSANQVLHIPGAGDFQIKQLQVLEQPPPLGLTHKGHANGDSASAMEVSASQLVGEQTWPTDKVSQRQHQPLTQNPEPLSADRSD